LSCLLAYKSPHLRHHEEKLRLLLDETKWRDELTSLHMSSIESKDRHQLVDIIVRLLYGLMLGMKDCSRGGDRRPAVLTALTRCADQELSSRGSDVESNESSSAACQDGLFSLHRVSSNVSFKQRTGYLTLLGDVLESLGSTLTTYWPALLGTTLHLLKGFCRV
jgi:hypothetical protein